MCAPDDYPLLPWTPTVMYCNAIYYNIIYCDVLYCAVLYYMIDLMQNLNVFKDLDGARMGGSSLLICTYIQ